MIHILNMHLTSVLFDHSSVTVISYQRGVSQDQTLKEHYDGMSEGPKTNIIKKDNSNKKRAKLWLSVGKILKNAATFEPVESSLHLKDTASSKHIKSSLPIDGEDGGGNSSQQIRKLIFKKLEMVSGGSTLPSNIDVLPDINFSQACLH